MRIYNGRVFSAINTDVSTWLSKPLLLTVLTINLSFFYSIDRQTYGVYRFDYRTYVAYSIDKQTYADNSIDHQTDVVYTIDTSILLCLHYWT